MDNNKFFEEILLELSYRSDEGYPDFSKPQHITILSEILTEWGMTDVKFELIKNLLKEEEEKPFPRSLCRTPLKSTTHKE